MEDARDTLGRWAAQLIAIVGLNVCGWGFLFNLHIIESGGSEEQGVHTAALLLPILAVAFWRLLDLRRWAAWSVCVLLAWRCVEAWALLGQKGGRSWSSFLWLEWHSLAGGLACAVALAALLCTRLLCPNMWREGF